MKEITKEKKSTYTVYQAVDGTEFDSKVECQKYDGYDNFFILTTLQEVTDNITKAE